jgi:ubiquinone/menaquinone biosynthesis C-methylase UbiE
LPRAPAGRPWPRPAGRDRPARVVATDISPAIHAFAAKAAAQAGLTNVETLEADGEALGALAGGGFDAVICRLGLIYFPDQHRALTGMARVLRDGGRAAAIVYPAADRNQFFSIPGVDHP